MLISVHTILPLARQMRHTYSIQYDIHATIATFQCNNKMEVIQFSLTLLPFIKMSCYVGTIGHPAWEGRASHQQNCKMKSRLLDYRMSKIRIQESLFVNGVKLNGDDCCIFNRSLTLNGLHNGKKILAICLHIKLICIR